MELKKIKKEIFKLNSIFNTFLYLILFIFKNMFFMIKKYIIKS